MSMGNIIGYSCNNTAWQLPANAFASNNWGAGLNMNNNSNLFNNMSWSGYGGSWSTSGVSSENSSETADEREMRYKRELAEKNKQAKKALQTEHIQANSEQLEKDCWNLLAEDYSKSMKPSESFLGAAAGGAAFGVINNPRVIAHPINTVKGFKDTNKMFADVTKEGSKLNKAWKANSPVMEEAYAQMQKLSSRKNSKLGLFRKQISEGEYKRLTNIMQKALKGKNGVVNINEVAEAAAKLKHSYVNDGYIPRAWHWVKGKFGGTSKVANVSERLGESAKIQETAAAILKHGKDMTYLDALKKGGGVKGGILMAAFEVLLSKNKIEAAFDKDSKTGWKQVGQTTLKASGNAIGWAAGEALGVWGAAKLGAAIGTGFGPGIGTAIGAVAGVLVGSIGCWAAGKLTHCIAGDDIGDSLLAENKIRTEDGRQELLMNAAARLQNDEIKEARTKEAVQGLLSKYSYNA